MDDDFFTEPYDNATFHQSSLLPIFGGSLGGGGGVASSNPNISGSPCFVSSTYFYR